MVLVIANQSKYFFLSPGTGRGYADKKKTARSRGECGCRQRYSLATPDEKHRLETESNAMQCNALCVFPPPPCLTHGHQAREEKQQADGTDHQPRGWHHGLGI